MQGVWRRGIDRNARTRVIRVRAGRGEGESGEEGRGSGEEGEKQQEARKQERFWSCSICIRAFCVCKSSAPTILFSRSTLPTKRLCRAPTRPRRIFPQNLQLTRIVKRAIFKVGEIILRNPVFNSVEKGEGGMVTSYKNFNIPSQIVVYLILKKRRKNKNQLTNLTPFANTI